MSVNEPSKSDHERVSLLDLGTDKPELDEDLSDLDKLTGEELNSVSAKKRKIIARNRVRSAVRDHGVEAGVTVSEIEEATGLTQHTIRSHLESLCKLREVYKIKKGGVTLYFPNGKPLHGFGIHRVEAGDATFEVQLAEGRNGDLFFHVLEKRFTLLEGESTEGAIMFPVSHLNQLTNTLERLAEEIER